MSPTTRLISLSRIDEKNALVSLNDRLAMILSRNRTLENENTLLNVQVSCEVQRSSEVKPVVVVTLDQFCKNQIWDELIEITWIEIKPSF